MPAQRQILLVTCHPEPRSLNGALRDHAVATLEGLGHRVLQSDLYAMGWKAAVDHDDFPQEPEDARLHVGAASRRATEAKALTSDVVAEQAKIMAADALVFQFPLWWFGPPAMLKGWFDRVFSNGFAYGITAPGARYSTRYGEGTLLGKRAMLSVTTGGFASHFSARGVNGALDDLLFPVTHGTLFYTGMDVLPNFAVHGTNRFTEESSVAVRAAYTKRLEALFSDAPIPFRAQNGGDYDNDLQLEPGVGEGSAGFALHRRG